MVNNRASINAKGPHEQTPLHTAAYFGNLSAIKKLVEAGAEINAQESADSNQRTPLHTACFRGYIAVVKYLLTHGANPQLLNKNGETALKEAVIFGHDNVIKFFTNYAIENPGKLAKNDEKLCKEYGEVKKTNHLLDCIQTQEDPKDKTSPVAYYDDNNSSQRVNQFWTLAQNPADTFKPKELSDKSDLLENKMQVVNEEKQEEQEEQGQTEEVVVLTQQKVHFVS